MIIYLAISQCFHDRYLSFALWSRLTVILGLEEEVGATDVEKAMREYCIRGSVRSLCNFRMRSNGLRSLPFHSPGLFRLASARCARCSSAKLRFDGTVETFTRAGQRSTPERELVWPGQTVPASGRSRRRVALKFCLLAYLCHERSLLASLLGQ